MKIEDAIAEWLDRKLREARITNILYNAIWCGSMNMLALSWQFRVLTEQAKRAAIAATELRAALKTLLGPPISYAPWPKVACGIVIHRGIFAG